MNKFFKYFFLFVCFKLHAQPNLVYNGDFEIYSACPNNFSSPGFYEIEKCRGWFAPTYGTSDYYNTCAVGIPAWQVGVPYNGLGYQKPYSGNGYCGFLAFSYSNGGCYSGSYWWEYIQGRFTKPLEAGRTYSIGFYFSLSDCFLAVKELGIYITKDSSKTCSPAPLNYIPQITSGNSAYLKDTTNWFLISGNYVAQGGEKYLIIGNFKDSLSTDTFGISTYDPSLGIEYSYYYLDGGSVTDITESLNQTKECKVEDELVPQLISANGDGKNDVHAFKVCGTFKRAQIFNRWGNVVFETTDPTVYWDGKNKQGGEYPTGTYFYLIQTEEKIFKGFVQLER